MLTLYLNNQPLPNPAILCEWQSVTFHYQPPAGHSPTLTLIGPLQHHILQPVISPDDATWRWTWNPRNTTGQFQLQLTVAPPDQPATSNTYRLAVVPGKLAADHHAALLHDLQQLANDLVIGLGNSTAGATSATPNTATTPSFSLLADYCRLTEQQLPELERLLTRLERQPHTTLQPTTHQVPLEQARNLTRLDPHDLVRAPASHQATSPEQPPRPATLRQQSSHPTTDTYENRFVKLLLKQLTRRARQIAQLAQSAQSAQIEAARAQGSLQQANKTLAVRSAALLQRLQRLQHLPFLAEVGELHQFQGPSLIMRRDTPYRQLYRLWQTHRAAPLLSIDSPLFHVPVHDLPRLYETWCLLCVVQALLTAPDVTVVSQQLFTPLQAASTAAAASHLTAQLRLTEDKPLLLLHRPHGPLALRYQPRYRPATPETLPGSHISLDRFTHIPDMTLEWQPPAAPPTVLVLDAKYRLDTQGTLPADALADAYTYLGSIGRPPNHHSVHRAALLFPGTIPPEHYPSGISAVSLLPGAVAPFQNWLHHILGLTE